MDDVDDVMSVVSVTGIEVVVVSSWALTMCVGENAINTATVIEGTRESFWIIVQTVRIAVVLRDSDVSPRRGGNSRVFPPGGVGPSALLTLQR